MSISSSLPSAGPGLLRAVRDCLGLTQQQLAEYLGVRRVRVAEAEAGTRPLPLAALPRLAALATCLAPASEAPVAEAADAAALRRRQRAATAEAGRLRQQLTQAEARAAQASARLALLPTLAAAPPVAAPAVGPAWLRVLALEAETTLAEAGPTARLLLRLRAEALEQEAAALAARLA
jgi:transcriptional regulator with XRE-family HTH domain